MRFIGREDEIAALAGVFDSLGPSLTVVRGREGSGTSALVAQALGDRPRLTFAAAPLTDAHQRTLLTSRLGAWLGEEDPGHGADWPLLLERIADRLERGRERTVLVLDGMEHLLAARSRLIGMIAAFWGRVRARSLPLHLVLVGSDPEALGALSDEGRPLEDAITVDLEIGPLPYRAVTDLLDAWPPRERMIGWAVWGGMPAVVRLLDPAAGLGANLRRTVLDPDAPLLRAGSDLLRRSVQSPARYASILAALALGEREWGAVAAALPDFTSSGQLAPYLSRLETLRLIEIRRSLDAREGSRNRHYHPADPFLSFWYRFVLPNLSELEGGGAVDVWSRQIRPELDDHVRLHFPDAAREYVWRYAERLPAPAREAGALWGSGYALDLAATLRSGAVCYGLCDWSEAPAGEAPLDRIEHALRESRYGFGREARLRVFVHAGGVREDLARRAARDDQIRLIGLADLLGTA